MTVRRMARDAHGLLELLRSPSDAQHIECWLPATTSDNNMLISWCSPSFAVTGFVGPQVGIHPAMHHASRCVQIWSHHGRTVTCRSSPGNCLAHA